MPRRGWKKLQDYHRKRKGKSKKEKVNDKTIEVERTQIGPYTIERFGRIVKLSSTLNENNFKERQKAILSAKPELFDKINTNVEEIISFIENYNPHVFLTNIFLNNCFADPELFEEATFTGRECYAEYAINLISGIECKSFENAPSIKEVNYFGNLIKEIYNLVSSYFAAELAEKFHGKTKTEIRFKSILKFIGIRGDSYSQHHEELFLALFSAHNSILRQNFGFTASDIINFTKEIENQLNSNVNRQIKVFRHQNNVTRLFNEWLQLKEVELTSKEMNKAFDEFISMPQIKQEMNKFNKDDFIFLTKNPFIIKLDKNISSNLLNIFSTTFGENSSFISFPKTPGWPLNDSIIYKKPILRHNNSYYGYGNVIFHRNMISIVENLIKNVDSKYFLKQFERSRSRFLEEKSLSYFKAILPDSDVYHKLFYSIVEDGQRKRCETDGLILYDENLFIIEAKAINYQISARRGSVPKIQKILEKNVEEAYQQAIRTRNYVMNNNPARFENESGKLVIEIDNADFRNIYLINVTIENLGFLATQINKIKKLNLIQGKEWLWSVFINDLRVISEIIESPSIFLLYLQRRIRANDFPEFELSDELDYFSYFLKERLYLEDITKDHEKGITTLVGYTAPLDRYYSYLEGKVLSAEKPVFKASDDLKKTVREIETMKKKGSTFITTILLGLNLDFQEEILDQIKEFEKKTLENGMDHTIFFTVKEIKSCFRFVITPNSRFSKLDEHINYVELKMYENKLNSGIIIVITSSPEGKKILDFEIIHKNWQSDPVMEKKLKDHQFTRSWEIKGKKIGRNEPCPCGSGRKYKKCCEKRGD